MELSGVTLALISSTSVSIVVSMSKQPGSLPILLISSFHCSLFPSISSSDLFSASSYASAYYVYLWAEVLDAGE